MLLMLSTSSGETCFRWGAGCGKRIHSFCKCAHLVNLLHHSLTALQDPEQYKTGSDLEIKITANKDASTLVIEYAEQCAFVA